MGHHWPARFELAQPLGLVVQARSRGGTLPGSADAGGRSIRRRPLTRWWQDRLRSSTGEGGVDLGGGAGLRGSPTSDLHDNGAWVDVRVSVDWLGGEE
jgi:hypothetical protein